MFQNLLVGGRINLLLLLVGGGQELKLPTCGTGHRSALVLLGVMYCMQ